MWPWLYYLSKAIVSFFYHILYRIRVEGLEHLPRDGGVIVCCNHFHANDPLIMGVTTPRIVRYMAKQELFKIPVVGWVIRKWGAFPVRRGQADRASLKVSLEILESGGCFGIFPEGTRSKTGQLRKAEPGTAYLALKSGAPVVPVGINATYRLFSPVRVRFGPPVDLEPYRSGKLTSENLEAAGAAIMAAIGALLDSPTGTADPASNLE